MKEVLRRCVGCREMINKSLLLRVVCSGDSVVIDTSKKLMGRGAYICKNKECITKASKKRGIERSLKRAKFINDIYTELLTEVECEVA